MKIAIAKAHNGVHKKISQELKKIGIASLYFDIDQPDWWKSIQKINNQISAYFWNADDKGKYYYQINDRVYLLEQLTNKPVFPNTKQYFFYNDKISQLNFLKFNNLPYPKTFVTYSKVAATKFINQTKYPFVLKDAHSASAMGVFLIKNKKEAHQINNLIFSTNGYNGIFGHFYAQEFINKLDRDLRIITINSKVVSAYWRINKDDWRHNIGLGGEVNNKNIPIIALKLAEKISQLGNFHWMAFDILVKNNKLYVLEFSCNFGTKGPDVLGINIRQLQANYLKKCISNSK